jgi:hypothetical protein
LFYHEFKMISTIYKFFKTQIQDWEKEMNEIHRNEIEIKTKDRKNFFVISLKTKSEKMLQSSKNQFSDIIQENIVKIPEDEFQYFSSNKSKAFIQDIQSKYNVFIYFNNIDSTLKIFGSRNSRIEVEKLLSERFQKSDQTIEFEKISIKKGSFKTLVEKDGKGIQRLKEKFNVKIELFITKNQLFIRGSKENIEKVVEFINEKLGSFQEKKEEEITESECICCYDDLDQTTECKISCGHKICKSCFKMQMESAISNFSADFPVKCSICKEKFTVNDIKDNLSFTFLNEMYNTSFKKFLSENQDWIACPTPNCTIYKVSEKKNLRHQCQVCSRSYCESCQKYPHQNVSCLDAENQKVEDFSSFAHKCPSCGSWVEKNGGCNRLTCVCGNSFCWICGFGAKTSTEVYSHLTKDHGGYFS